MGHASCITMHNVTTTSKGLRNVEPLEIPRFSNHMARPSCNLTPLFSLSLSQGSFVLPSFSSHLVTSKNTRGDESYPSFSLLLQSHPPPPPRPYVSDTTNNISAHVAHIYPAEIEQLNEALHLLLVMFMWHGLSFIIIWLR